MRKLIRKTRLSLGAVAALLLTFGSSQPASAQVEPFLGQLMPVVFGYCPQGWRDANGDHLLIGQHQALFSLFGTTYGGDGQSTFGLPDLQGRYAMGVGTGAGLSPRMLGEKSGFEALIQDIEQLAPHDHIAMTTATLRGTSTIRNTDTPLESVALAATRGTDIYAPGFLDTDFNKEAILATTTVELSGGGRDQTNMPPFLVIRWCVAILGTFSPKG